MAPARTSKAGGGGANVPTLSNAIDGVLEITESAPGGSWSIVDDFNVIKESAARDDLSGRYGFGGLDLTGLDSIEFDVSHSGVSEVFGQVFLQPNTAGGCCSFLTAPISVQPGAAQTVSVNLSDFGISPIEQQYIRTIGFEVFGHGEGPLDWEISEIRSVGSGLTERVIADHSTGSLENAVVKFDDLGIQGSGGTDNQTGLSNLGDGLRWIDLGGTGDPGDESGGAIAYGNNGALAVTFDSRPLDLSNYDTATVAARAIAEPGANPGAPSVELEFFAQYANRATGNEFDFQDAGILSLPTDGSVYELDFPLSGLTDMDLVQWVGLNVSPHEGGRVDIRIESVVLSVIPEPATIGLLATAIAPVLSARRRR